GVRRPNVDNFPISTAKNFSPEHLEAPLTLRFRPLAEKIVQSAILPVVDNAATLRRTRDGFCCPKGG
ncbi:hypothetical protein, partial [Alcanivorax xiamenensis]|uniref:hypothetical protein n=1 Tax=Alcanivorax xiamenensis TaxID=1177156 RepID=UPI001F1A3363